MCLRFGSFCVTEQIITIIIISFETKFNYVLVTGSVVFAESAIGSATGMCFVMFSGLGYDDAFSTITACFSVIRMCAL